MKVTRIMSVVILFILSFTTIAFASGPIKGRLYYKDFEIDRSIVRVKMLIYAYEIFGSSIVAQDQEIETEMILSSANQTAKETGWRPVPEYSKSKLPEIMISLRFSVDASRNRVEFYRHMYLLKTTDLFAKQKLRGGQSLEEFCKEALEKYEVELKRRYFFK